MDENFLTRFKGAYSTEIHLRTNAIEVPLLSPFRYGIQKRTIKKSSINSDILIDVNDFESGKSFQNNSQRSIDYDSSKWHKKKVQITENYFLDALEYNAASDLLYNMRSTHRQQWTFFKLNWISKIDHTCLLITYNLKWNCVYHCITSETIVTITNEDDQIITETALKKTDKLITMKITNIALLKNKMYKLSLKFKGSFNSFAYGSIELSFSLNNISVFGPDDENVLIMSDNDDYSRIKAFDMFGTALTLRHVKSESASEKCLNGGYTSSISTKCICPPGFNGKLCETGCGANHYGSDCKGVCSLYESMCRGILLCTNSYGCTCPPGLTGPLCNKDCKLGYYGTNCELKCSSNCSNYACDQYTGVCRQGCSPGYVAPNCEEKYPYLINSPALLSTTYQSIEIELNFQSDNVKGEQINPKIKYYQIFYKSVNEDEYKKSETVEIVENNRTSVVINDLKSNTEYKVAVLLISEDWYFNEENMVYGHYRTSCSQPDVTDYNIKIKSGVKNVTITWNEIIPKQFECDIDQYILTLMFNQSKNQVSAVQEIVASSNNGHFIDNLLSGNVYDVILTPKTIKGSLRSSPTYSFTTIVSDNDVKIKDVLITTENRKINLSWRMEYSQLNITLKEPITCLIRYKINKLLSCSLYEIHNNWTSVKIYNRTTYEIQDTVPNAHYSVQIFIATDDVDSIQGANMANIVTPAKNPETEPILDFMHPIYLTNSSALVQWKINPTDCSKINGFFTEFYIELKNMEDNALQILQTKQNFMKVENLKSNSLYEVKVFVKTHVGYNRERYLFINFTTKYENLKAVDDLMVYKKSLKNRIAGLRWSYGNNTNLNGFLVSINEDPAKNESNMFAIPMQKCSAWPLYYCYIFNNLIPSNKYTFKIKPTSIDYPEGGKVSSITFNSIDGIPDPPSNINAIAIGQTNLTLQWDMPWLLNGVLNKFIINVEEISSLDMDTCCSSIAPIEIPTEEELPLYNYTITGLNPGSSYSIGVLTVSKSLWYSSPSRISISTLLENK